MSLPDQERFMTASARLVLPALLVLLSAGSPVRGQAEPPPSATPTAPPAASPSPAPAPASAPAVSGDDLCGPRGLTIPLTVLQPRNRGAWITVTDLKDRWCRNVAPTELRIRAKPNSDGEIEITFKVTTFTRHGHDKRVAVIFEVMNGDRAVKTTTIEAIDAKENKSGRGTGYMF